MTSSIGGTEISWDSEISNDSSFTLIPEGDYYFKVLKFEKGRHTPKQGGKIPECFKAVLTLLIFDEDGRTMGTCETSLFLHSSQEWKLSAFFRSIGLKRHGETIRMDWGKVQGATGMARVKERSYISRNGEERKANEIDNFLDKNESAGTGDEADSAF